MILWFGLHVSQVLPIRVNGYIVPEPKQGFKRYVDNKLLQVVMPDIKYAGDVTMLIAGGHEDVRPGTKWIGEEGWVWVDRSGIEASPRALLSSKIGPNELRLPVTASHHRQFIDCVLSSGETLMPARAEPPKAGDAADQRAVYRQTS